MTGAGGFVGTRLCAHLLAHGVRVRALSLRGGTVAGAEPMPAADYDDHAALARAMDGADAVIHLAARAHVVDDRAVDPLAQFRRINVELSLQVADAAMAAGVRRLVFVSSIGAVGSGSAPGRPLHEGSICAPVSPYGRSKREAEQSLATRLAGRPTELVVLRPPLVHGPGAPGNLARLRRWIDAGMPLPLASVRNQRSLLHIDNLTRLLHLCAGHPQAAGRTFHARDARDRSTPELIREAARSRGRRACLFPLPIFALMALGGIAGRKDTMSQLTGWLQIDDTLVRQSLGFTPDDRPITL